MIETNVQRTLKKLSMKTFSESSYPPFSDCFCASRDICQANLVSRNVLKTFPCTHYITLSENGHGAVYLRFYTYAVQKGRLVVTKNKSKAIHFLELQEKEK